jgi:hypothetical protein
METSVSEKTPLTRRGQHETTGHLVDKVHARDAAPVHILITELVELGAGLPIPDTKSSSTPSIIVSKSAQALF